MKEGTKEAERSFHVSWDCALTKKQKQVYTLPRRHCKSNFIQNQYFTSYRPLWGGIGCRFCSASFFFLVKALKPIAQEPIKALRTLNT